MEKVRAIVVHVSSIDSIDVIIPVQSTLIKLCNGFINLSGHMASLLVHFRFPCIATELFRFDTTPSTLKSCVVQLQNEHVNDARLHHTPFTMYIYA